MTKHKIACETLAKGKKFTMTVRGNSMLPLIKSGSNLTFSKTDDYEVGDVVLSKVKGRWIDAHKITKIGADGRYMISNNRGWDNGWTKQVFGRVVAVNGNQFGRKIKD